jgi:membrane-associated protease RseP (regulator of RpoE activity)
MLDSRKAWLLLVLAGLLVPVALMLGESRAQGVVVAEAPEVDEPTYVYVGSAHEAAYMGVQLEEETDYPEGGARVSEVVHDSPAEKAGLQAGDIIVGFDGKTIRGPVALTKQIHDRKPGDAVTVDFVRDGRKQSIEIELADRTSRYGSLGYTVAPFGDIEFVAPEIEHEMQEKIERSLEHLEHIELPQIYGLAECEEGVDCGGYSFRFRWGGQPRLGVELVETTPELKEHLGSSDGAGVLVSKVLRGLPAEHADIRVGDLIVRIGGDPVEDVSDLRQALGERAGETFTVQVIRDGKAVDLDVTLPEPDEDEVSGPRARVLRVPRVPHSPPVHVVPPVAPAEPGVAAPPAPAAPRSRRSVEAYERQQAETRAALAEAREEARRVADVERAAVRELQRQVREVRGQERELARAEARERHEAVAGAELERARRAYREAAAVQREKSRRQREEIRLLRERLRAADGSV